MSHLFTCFDDDKEVTPEDWIKGRTLEQLQAQFGKSIGQLLHDGTINLSQAVKHEGLQVATLGDLKKTIDPYFIEPIIDTKALKGARFQANKLRDKFYKHAKHLGIVTTKNNPKTQKQFQDKIIEFMNDERVIQKGVYKNKGNKVWCNPDTKVAVIFDKNNNFLTVLQLEDDLQYHKYMKDNFLW